MLEQFIMELAQREGLSLTALQFFTQVEDALHAEPVHESGAGEH